MGPEDQQRITDELHRWAERNRDVLGLVAVGSTAGTLRQADRWSDHDLLIITRRQCADRLRTQHDWLPDPERIAIVFPEPDHGLTVIYQDGHLIETAVTEIDDLAWFRADTYRVLVDKHDVALQLRAIEQAADDAPTPTSFENYQRLLKELLIATTRLARGERLSAYQHLYGMAVPHLLALLRQLAPDNPEAPADPYDPTRRFERHHPAVATPLAATLHHPGQLTATILDLLRTHVIGHLEGAASHHLEPIERRLSEAGEPTLTTSADR